jgi:peptidyl serine alpha-galactosyltransferase
MGAQSHAEILELGMQEWLNLGPTHVAKSMAINPHSQDHYNAYNKPYAVIDFLTRAPPEEDWLILLDSDMLLRLPFICGGTSFQHNESHALEMDCVRGHPIAAFYGYLKGVSNDLAVRHIPDVPPRNDTNGGQPFGRRSDQVGGIFIVHKDDMREYMNDWLTITEDVRFDPEVCNCRQRMLQQTKLVVWSCTV